MAQHLKHWLSNQDNKGWGPSNPHKCWVDMEAQKTETKDAGYKQLASKTSN